MSTRSHTLRSPVHVRTLGAALLVMLFYLPLRFLAAPGGLDVWPWLVLGLNLLGTGTALRFLLTTRRLTGHDLLFALLLLYGVAALAITGLRYTRFDVAQGLRLYWLPATLYFAGRSMQSEADRQELLCVLLFGCLVISAFYVLDYAYFFFWADRPLSAPWTAMEGYRWTQKRSDRIGGFTGGVFGYPHPNGVAAAMGLILAVAWLLDPERRSRRGRIALALAALVCAMPLILGASKSALVVTLIVLPLLLRLRIVRAWRVRYRRLYLVLLAVATAAVAIVAYRLSTVHIQSVYYRLMLWRSDNLQIYYSVLIEDNLFPFLASRPLMALLAGTGFAASEAAIASGGAFASNDLWSVHMMSQIGVFGWLLMCALPVAALARLAWRRRRVEAGLTRNGALALALASCAFWPSLHSDVLKFIGISHWFYLLLGIGMSPYLGSPAPRCFPSTQPVYPPARVWPGDPQTETGLNQ